MQEHALPQDVTGYKFHIIGNMTLKQFGEVAAGCIVGFLLYQTNLLPFIKYPLIVLAAGGGAMIAFVPIEERPLDQWITAFFNALYRPTQYYWKRLPKIPEPFLYEPKSELRTVVEDVDLTPARRQRVKDYLRSIDEKPSSADQFDHYTEQRLGEVMGEFGTQLRPSLAYAVDTAQVDTQQVADEAAILAANPDTISSTVDNLSFAGRGMSEEVVSDQGPTDQEVEMSNSVLRLFDNPDGSLPLPDTVPQYQPESPIIPEQPVAEQQPIDTVGESSPVITEPVLPAPPAPEPVPAPVLEPTPALPPEPEPPSPEPIPQAVPEPIKVPEPEPIIELKPIVEAPKPEPKPEVKVVESSFVPPTPPPQYKSAAQQPPQRPREVPQDMAELPDVSLTPEENDDEPITAEIPQISTIFDAPSAPAESIPKVETMAKYSLSSHPDNADSSEIADVADVIALAGGNQHPRGKSTVQFKTSRTSNSDKYETVLPHILDMTGSAESVKIEPKAAPIPDKVVPENKEVIVPELVDIRIERTAVAPEESKSSDASPEMASAVDPSLLEAPEKQAAIQTTGAVTFNAELPFPEKPTQPNKVVGMVINQEGVSQPNAIVEILSPDGIPARAVKTNPLGQFFIATPLNPGEYLITAEKDGLKFSTQQLSITNKIIDPIEIKAN